MHSAEKYNLAGTSMPYSKITEGANNKTDQIMHISDMKDRYPCGRKSFNLLSKLQNGFIPPLP